MAPEAAKGEMAAKAAKEKEAGKEQTRKGVKDRTSRLINRVSGFLSRT